MKIPGEKVESFDTTFSIPITKSYPYGPSKFSINVVDDDNSQTVKAYKFKVRKPKKQSSLAPVLSLSTKSPINKYYYGDSITLSISSATKTGINVIYFLESRKTVFVKIPGETVESFDTTLNLPITPSYPNGLSEFSVSMIDDDNTQTIETYEFEVLQNNVPEKEAQSLPLLSLGTISSTDKYFYGDSITFLISANAKAGINTIDYISKSTSPLYKNSPNETINNFDTTLNFSVPLSYPPGLAEIRFILLDNDGVEVSKTYRYEILAKKISNEQDLAWQRIGGGVATGLNNFGLSWELNSNKYVIIKKNAVKLVKLSQETYRNVKSFGALKVAIDSKRDQDEILEISVIPAQKEYKDLIIGTQTNSKTYYMIKVNSATVVTTDIGSTINIVGNFKRSL